MLQDFHSEVLVLSQQPGATAADLETLRSRYPALPADVTRLMSVATELELSYRGRYLRLYGPSGCIEMDEAYEISEYIPNAIVLGDNGGSEALVFLDSHGLCRVPYGDLDVDELQFVSSSLSALLIDATAPPDALGGVQA